MWGCPEANTKLKDGSSLQSGTHIYPIAAEGIHTVFVENMNSSICKQMMELLGEMLGVSSL
ncbi:hypothetical protein BC351_39980 [Paenibacillus ferrarius]|uniref:Uncharacterized protein n=1 Tax=Paenibacillus ferrarius TaxID=1469647 RepID=A0A1V4H879_9BACL|nr:hypothetical protein BC351_39980 [Paenibacillus ferrarius]